MGAACAKKNLYLLCDMMIRYDDVDVPSLVDTYPYLHASNKCLIERKDESFSGAQPPEGLGDTQFGYKYGNYTHVSSNYTHIALLSDTLRARIC